VLFNSINADFYRNMGEQDGKVVLKNMGAMNPRKISGIKTAFPTCWLGRRTVICILWKIQGLGNNGRCISHLGLFSPTIS